MAVVMLVETAADTTETTDEERVILVDVNDNPIGTEEKVKCHLPNGMLHRAFTALLFESRSGRLLLGRRANDKMLWPGCWDGTFASHPRESETYISSCTRRMPEELGVQTEFDYMHKFEYHVPYKDVGSENEICGTLIGTITDASEIFPTESEIDEVKTTSAKELGARIAADPKTYCPWMLVALYLLDRSKRETLEKYKTLLEPWINSHMRRLLFDAISIHMPREMWRVVQ